MHQCAVHAQTKHAEEANVSLPNLGRLAAGLLLAIALNISPPVSLAGVCMNELEQAQPWVGVSRVFVHGLVYRCMRM